MKKIILVIVLLLSILSFVYAEDSVKVQVRFRQAIWACPGGREITDLNVGSPSVYEHTCKDGTWLNSFKEYSGVLSYTPEEYEKADSVEKAKAKSDLVNAWLYEVDNPPVYQEPSKSDYINLYNSRLEEAQQYLGEYEKVASKEELEAVKADLTQKVDTLTDTTGTNQVYYCTINDVVAATAGDAVWSATTCDNNTVDAQSTGWVTTCGARRIMIIQ